MCIVLLHLCSPPKTRTQSCLFCLNWRRSETLSMRWIHSSLIHFSLLIRLPGGPDLLLWAARTFPFLGCADRWELPRHHISYHIILYQLYSFLNLVLNAEDWWNYILLNNMYLSIRLSLSLSLSCCLSLSLFHSLLITVFFSLSLSDLYPRPVFVIASVSPSPAINNFIIHLLRPCLVSCHGQSPFSLFSTRWLASALLS